MRPFGVRVSIIEPGAFRTDLIDPAVVARGLWRLWERLPAETKAAYGPRYMETCECTPPSPPLTPAVATGRADPAAHADARSAVLVHRAGSTRLSPVTDAMAHALLARCPRSRYTAGWDARLLFLPLSYSPAWLSDAITGLFLPVPAQGEPART